MLSRLQPDSAVVVGVLGAVGTLLIYNGQVPNLTDVRSADAHNDDVDKARRTAAIESVVLIGGLSLFSRDLTPWILGGIALIGMDYAVKHHNSIDPATGSMVADTGGDSIAQGMVHSLPSYDESAA